MAIGSLGRRAFTLIELLVVVGIIGVLMGLLVPSLGRARAAAQNAVCASNVHTILLAANLYGQEQNGLLPDGDGGRLSGNTPRAWVMPGAANMVEPFWSSKYFPGLPDTPSQGSPKANSPLSSPAWKDLNQIVGPTTPAITWWGNAALKVNIGYFYLGYWGGYNVHNIVAPVRLTDASSLELVVDQTYTGNSKAVTVYPSSAPHGWTGVVIAPPDATLQQMPISGTHVGLLDNSVEWRTPADIRFLYGMTHHAQPQAVAAW